MEVAATDRLHHNRSDSWCTMKETIEKKGWGPCASILHDTGQIYECYVPLSLINRHWHHENECERIHGK